MHGDGSGGGDDGDDGGDGGGDGEPNWMNQYYSLSSDAPLLQDLKSDDVYWAGLVLAAEKELAYGASAPPQLPATYFLQDVLDSLELQLYITFVNDATPPAVILKFQYSTTSVKPPKPCNEHRKP